MKYTVTFNLDLFQPIDTIDLAHRILRTFQCGLSQMPRGVAEIITIVPEDVLRKDQNAIVDRVSEIIRRTHKSG